MSWIVQNCFLEVYILGNRSVEFVHCKNYSHSPWSTTTVAPNDNGELQSGRGQVLNPRLKRLVESVVGQGFHFKVVLSSARSVDFGKR